MRLKRGKGTQWVRFYPADVFIQTAGMSDELKGAYLTCVTMQLMYGRVPPPDQLRHHSPFAAEHWDLLEPYFPDGKNPDWAEELDRAESIYERRVGHLEAAREKLKQERQANGDKSD